MNGAAADRLARSCPRVRPADMIAGIMQWKIRPEPGTDRAMRFRSIATACLAALLLAACAGVSATPPASDTAGLPPTAMERAMLGLDANNPYFLRRFRECAAWASYTYCQAEMYGGLTP